jgi:hypothetical protein
MHGMPHILTRVTDMAMGVPTDILMGMAVPGMRDGVTSGNWFAMLDKQNEAGSMTTDVKHKYDYCVGDDFHCLSEGSGPNNICPKWELFFDNIGKAFATANPDDAPESIQHLFLAQTRSADQAMVEFWQKLDR